MALSDVLQGLPNYIHPDYATPGQIAQAREYAKFLMEPGKGQIPVKSWQAGLANALNQGIAGWEMGNAIRSEQKLYNSGLKDQTAAIAQQLQESPSGSPTPPPVTSAPLPPVASAAPAAAPAPVPAPTPAGPVPGTPNGRVADAFADTNDAIRTGAFDPVGSNNIGPDGFSPSPYKVASINPTAPVPSPAPAAPTAAATAPPAAAPSSPGGAPIRMAQAGADPATIARILMNPVTPPQVKDYASSLIAPKPAEDVYGRPGVSTVAGGVRAQPVGPGFQPGFRAPVSAGDVSSTSVVTPPGTGGAAPVSAVPGLGNTGGIDALAAKSRELNAEKTRMQGGVEAQTGMNQEDIKAASSAPGIIKDLGVIKQIIQTSPGITFGPTAGWSAEAKRVIANYAPGLTDEKSLAGADAIEKLNFGLAGQLARSVGGTQGELFKAIGATPGTEKSKQGALALIDMMQQREMKNQQLGQLYRRMEAANDLRNYPAAREKFLTENPITNPLTGRPVEMDIKAAREADAKNGPVAVSSPEEARKLPKGTQIRLPDGSIGRVP